MASVLIVDDEPAITATLGTYFERNGGHAVTKAHTGQEGINLFRQLRPDLVLLDVRLPDMTGFDVLDRIRDENGTVIMITAYGDVPLAVQAMQNGAENFLTKPVELAHLGAAAERAFEKSRLRQMNRFLASRRGNASSARVLLGSSAPMQELANQIEMLASSDRTTVLLIGESGAGKGRVAELIHSRSGRGARPFIEVNCAALTADTLDGELFGHDNGGPAKPGLFEVADGGSLFLDEIGDLGPTLQPKLLGVLEGKPFRRVGGTQEIHADVRLIAATSKDLVNEVTAGTFREDLYYRLSVMPVYLPPLRARSREDLIELIAHVLDDLRSSLPDAPPQIGDAALDRMLRYTWPGNIRELRNVLERATIVSRGAETIGPEHLPADVRDATGIGVEHHVPKSLDEVERSHIERTLRVHSGNRTHAARELGISRATLIKKIRAYGLHD
ncbi:MAG TPA: sigma-54 dependent transcriptional regulator [Gemmatimonadaceae bacterium]|jgi:two-component system response regulator AtoC|nr:sigma-54 dependent transcriptional regulator [Gemmatimonadaceae bacterium]